MKRFPSKGKTLLTALLLTLSFCASALEAPHLKKWHVHQWRDPLVWSDGWGNSFRSVSNVHQKLTIWFQSHAESTNDVVLVQMSRNGTKWRTVGNFPAGAVTMASFDLHSGENHCRVLAQNKATAEQLPSNVLVIPPLPKP